MDLFPTNLHVISLSFLGAAGLIGATCIYWRQKQLELAFTMLLVSLILPIESIVLLCFEQKVPLLLGFCAANLFGGLALGGAGRAKKRGYPLHALCLIVGITALIVVGIQLFRTIVPTQYQLVLAAMQLIITVWTTSLSIGLFILHKKYGKD